MEFDDTRYEQGDGELNARAYPNTLLSTVGSHTIYIQLFVAPDYSRESWTSVKHTLGLDFPNVSIDTLFASNQCCCIRARGPQLFNFLAALFD